MGNILNKRHRTNAEARDSSQVRAESSHHQPRDVSPQVCAHRTKAQAWDKSQVPAQPAESSHQPRDVRTNAQASDSPQLRAESSHQPHDVSPQVCAVCVIHLPPGCSHQELADFLEAALGRGRITQCRLRKDAEGGPKRNGMAFVQLRTPADAQRAICLSQEGLLIFKGSRLKVFPDSKPPRKQSDGMTAAQGVLVHAGCFIQKDVLYKLWTFKDCSIEVDNDRKRFCIVTFDSLSGNTYKLEWPFGNTYKLEWPFRDIVEFYRCRSGAGQTSEKFMLKVWYAPRIYKQSGTRTTDFTPKASIGESFAYCLELGQQSTGKLDHLMRSILGFSMQERNLIMKEGSCYSASPRTVPVLASAHLKGIPFDIVFLLNNLVQQGYLSGPGLTRSFFDHLVPSERMPLKFILCILKELERKQDTCFDPEKWFKREARKFMSQPQKEKLTNQFLPDGLMLVRKVFVTPSKVYFTGPEVEVSNRVTRHFKKHIDDFLRVSFVEEDADQIPATALMISGTRNLHIEHNDVYDRIVSVLGNGISIGNKSFEFLAFSTSQLRDSSAWMFSANGNITAESIRKWMGDFLGVRNVAKCAARMGQSFSSSTKSLDVFKYETIMIPDVWDDSGKKYCFSDGIGKISADFAVKVAKKCKMKNVPSLFQIRYGGFKGVVAVDPEGPYKLSLRQSMEKFPSSQISLDILNWSRVLPSYLNREIITLLSTLGVKDSVFENMQAKILQQLDIILSDTETALDVIRSFNGDGNVHQILIEMLAGGFHPTMEPFLMRMLHAFRANQLMDLQKKTRIFVSKGRLLMGCLDETRTLNYGQVYVSVSKKSGNHMFADEGLHHEIIKGIKKVPQMACIVKGRVIVAKNPCLHPGDVRLLTAVDVPKLRHLVDCIVFPQKGVRPHPNECSGSDLDGDLYFVSWDQTLIPPQVHEPQNYQPPPEEKLNRPVIIQDIIKYFADFIANNSLGLICNAHVVFADLSREGAGSPECLELSKLCSIAVDFPKTGVPANFPMHLRPSQYPDFMEKKDKLTYESEKILGKLYRAVVNANKNEEISSFTRQEAERCYDKQLEFRGFKDHLEEAAVLKNCYDKKLLDLMYQYDVKSEAEIFMGHILSLSKWFRKRPGEVQERIMRAMSSLRREARSWLKNANIDEKAGNETDDDVVSSEELMKASAWYHVTYHPDYVSDDVDEKYGHLLSFPWVLYDKLVFIKKRMAQSA